MTNSISKPSDNKPTNKADLYQVGQVFIDSRGDYIRVRENDGKVVKYDSLHHGEWFPYGSDNLDRMDNRDWIPVNDIENLETSALVILQHYHEMDDDTEELSQETAIVKADGKKLVEDAIQAVQAKMDMIEAARRVIERKTNEMHWMVSRMREKIERLNKIILVFELYLGVYEEIVQIQDGPAALSKTPISIRQLVLYMDEEVGDPRKKAGGQKGIDWQSIEDFDTWVLANYERVIPEDKGIVALKPSRQHRWYSADPWFNTIANAKNQMTYLLIRNGQKFYRIWTETNMGSLLFPTTDESDAIRKLLEDDNYSFDKRDAQDKQYVFVRNAMILQGLMDRTDILQPTPHRINLLNPDTYAGLVNFVRDGEYTLGDGRLRFSEWLKKINSKLQPGSRVFMDFSAQFQSGYYIGRDDYKHRFLIYFTEYNTPPLPKPGVYQLSLTDTEARDYDRVPDGTFVDIDGKVRQQFKQVAVKRRKLRIQYNPKDTVGDTGWSFSAYDPHPRKNRLSFLIYKNDGFIINVDQIDRSDIDYYLSNRIDRSNYLGMIPLLWGLRDFVISEREKEVDFVRLVAGRLGVDEDTVWEAVIWWRIKNKWKRSIRDDDAKALRMIEKRIRREIR